jgi:DNA-binding MarR family transcriptional regulator
MSSSATASASKSLRAPVCTPDMMAVLVELQDDAQNHRRCRSDADLGEATGMTADQVKWQLKKLEARRMIERRTVPKRPATARFRVVKVVATGAETAGPQ